MIEEANYTFPETAQKLKDLGIRIKPNRWWKLYPTQNKGKRYVLVNKLQPFQKGVPAWSLSEIGQMIPFGFFNQLPVMKFLGGYYKVKIDEKKELTFQTEVEARAHYLIHLIETGQATVN